MLLRKLQEPTISFEREGPNSSLLVYGKNTIVLEGKSKINKLAVFDLDGTIITTKSNAKFATSWDDWRFNYKTVPQIVQKYHKRGFLIVIVTNQLGISCGKVTIDDFTKKVQDILSQLGVPALLLAAKSNDAYRKPATGTWRYLLDRLLGIPQSSVDPASFFCGDSAGRRRKSAPADHSSCDLLYALNCGLRFYLPENMFFETAVENISLLDHHHKMVVREEFERRFVLPLRCFERICVIIMGPPKSGKSVIAGFFNEFTVFDCTEDAADSLEPVTEALRQDSFKLVIECAPEESELRERLMRVVKAADAFVVCFYLKYDYELMREVYYHANYSPYVRHPLVPFFPEDYGLPVKDLRNRLFNTTFEISYFPPAFGDACRVG